MSLTWRSLTEADVPAVTALNNLVAQADGTGEVSTEEGTREMFGMPRFTVEKDTISAWKGEALIALGVVFGRDALVDGRAMISLNGAVHPDHRSVGIGSDLLTRLEVRGTELAGEIHPLQPLRLRGSGGLPNSSSQALLEDRGYQPDNYFVTMQVELADWVDPGSESIAVVPDESLLHATRDAHNDAFRDHRNFSPMAADLWEHWGRSSQMRPALSQVITDSHRMSGDGASREGASGDGASGEGASGEGASRVLAYALTGEHEPGVAHVELVGTRREARGRGLARQVLLSSLRAAKEAGYRISELEVDSTSPTGADRLYASLGYAPVRVLSRYVRDVTSEE